VESAPLSLSHNKLEISLISSGMSQPTQSQRGRQRYYDGLEEEEDQKDVKQDMDEDDDEGDALDAHAAAQAAQAAEAGAQLLLFRTCGSVRLTLRCRRHPLPSWARQSLLAQLWHARRFVGVL
jgi:hypothetical protein